jgi:hypothetical protein
LAGKAGRLYGRVLKDEKGQEPVPFWSAHEEAADTRLAPGQADVRAFTFAAGAERVQVRLLYRRFWQAAADQFGWTDHETVVAEREAK